MIGGNAHVSSLCGFWRRCGIFSGHPKATLASKASFLDWAILVEKRESKVQTKPSGGPASMTSRTLDVRSIDIKDFKLQTLERRT